MPEQSHNIIDVCREGRELQLSGVYELRRFVEGRVYRDVLKHRAIGSIGQRFSDGRIFASCDTRFADNPNFSTLYLAP